MSIKDIHEKIEEQRPGPIRAVTLAKMAAAINRINQGAAPPAQLSRLAAGAGVATRFRLREVFDDYLVAVLIVNDNDGEIEIKLAKPYLLRKSPFNGLERNGVTYTYITATKRTADNGTAVVTEVIIPEYVAGDELYATRTRGGTGVSEAEVFMDLNIDGRAWAEVDPDT